MENSLLSLIDSATSILVSLPANPTFDQVASGLSLYLAIHDRKEVSIYCSTPMMVGFNRLIGVNKISTEIGNKNLVIKFADYDATNIDKVSYDIENGEFKLTVTPKTGLTSPQKDQVVTSFAGVSADLVILVGGITDADFPILTSNELANSKLVHVGTRALESQKEVLSFAFPGAGVSEIATRLIKENGLTFDADISTNLVMGIEEASSNFATNEVTPETFEIFAFLLRSGGQRMPRVKLSPVGYPPGAIPTKPFAVIPNQVSGSASKTAQQSNSSPVQQGVETSTVDPDNTQETEQELNPPSDWLQPKIYKGASVPQNPDSFSESKG